MSIPLAGDPVWDELPEGVDLVIDGDEVVGIAFGPDAGEIDSDDLNEFLARVEMPLLQPPE